MKHSTFKFSSKDGLELFGRAWQTEDKHPKGIIHLIHGLGEHSGRYDPVAKALTKAGYHMDGFDLRGHGLSEGKRGHTPSLDHFLDDISLFLDESGKLLDTSLPSFIYGHSLGGLLVLNYGFVHPERVSGAIVSDPALALSFRPPQLMWMIAQIMAKIVPTFSSNNALDVNALSRDAAVVKAYQDDVLVHDQISASHVVDMLGRGEKLIARAEDWTLPLLLMHGTEDRIASVEASRTFAEKAGPIVTFVPWEGYYHEVHNDIGKEKVIEKMISWLDDQVK